MASSETTGNMFTEYVSDIPNSEDQNKRIQMTRSYCVCFYKFANKICHYRIGLLTLSA